MKKQKVHTWEKKRNANKTGRSTSSILDGDMVCDITGTPNKSILLVYNQAENNKSLFVRLPVTRLNPQPFPLYLHDGGSSYTICQTDRQAGRQEWISKWLSRLYHLPR